jgi:hypothetical protein
MRGRVELASDFGRRLLAGGEQRLSSVRSGLKNQKGRDIEARRRSIFAIEDFETGKFAEAELSLSAL